MAPLRTTILTSIMAPHRIALFNALAQHPDIDLSVVYLSRTDPSRQWQTRESEMRYRHRVLRDWGRVPRGDGYVHITSGLFPALRQANPDVLIVGGWDQIAYQLARPFRLGSKTRLLWWVESTLRDRRSEGATARALKRRLVSAGADVVVPGSASLAYVESLGADRSRIWVAPNAVDNAAFSGGPRVSKEPVRFLFVGRLESGKGLGTLLDAWTRSGAATDLSIVGAGSMESSIRRRIAETSMPPVQLLGHLERGDLADAYRSADVFVFPSVSDPWGLVVNEAMAAGLPVIASSAPGAVDDLVRDNDNGFVVPPFDASLLATAIDALTTDADLRARMGARSLARIGAFTPDEWASGMRDAAMSVAGRAA